MRVLGAASDRFVKCIERYNIDQERLLRSMEVNVSVALSSCSRTDALVRESEGCRQGNGSSSSVETAVQQSAMRYSWVQYRGGYRDHLHYIESVIEERTRR